MSNSSPCKLYPGTPSYLGVKPFRQVPAVSQHPTVSAYPFSSSILLDLTSQCFRSLGLQCSTRTHVRAYAPVPRRERLHLSLSFYQNNCPSLSTKSTNPPPLRFHHTQTPHTYRPPLLMSLTFVDNSQIVVVLSFHLDPSPYTSRMYHYSLGHLFFTFSSVTYNIRRTLPSSSTLYLTSLPD